MADEAWQQAARGGGLEIMSHSQTGRRERDLEVGLDFKLSTPNSSDLLFLAKPDLLKVS